MSLISVLSRWLLRCFALARQHVYSHGRKIKKVLNIVVVIIVVLWVVERIWDIRLHGTYAYWKVNCFLSLLNDELQRLLQSVGEFPKRRPPTKSRRHYRRLAMKFHPDKTTGNKAANINLMRSTRPIRS